MEDKRKDEEDGISRQLPGIIVGGIPAPLTTSILRTNTKERQL
jgi:hypothetical protein